MHSRTRSDVDYERYASAGGTPKEGVASLVRRSLEGAEEGARGVSPVLALKRRHSMRSRKAAASSAACRKARGRPEGVVMELEDLGAEYTWSWSSSMASARAR
ncbi:hypothetical protein ZWY2020_054761 [Hordeum vulgare]|nr:hypothetical protein ZWY2020_054761 [Hordeum vulgare]